jgi:tryptophan synthase beta chain
VSKVEKKNSFRNGPDDRGHFGDFGGRFVAETLMPLVLSLERAYEAAKTDPAFKGELNNLLKHYVGRPSPLYYAERLSDYLGGAKIYFKREELNHTGAHKINNVMGQILLARRMARKESSPRRAPASMASRPPPPARALGCLASYIWAPSTSSDKSQTSFG